MKYAIKVLKDHDEKLNDYWLQAGTDDARKRIREDQRELRAAMEVLKVMAEIKTADV